ncbi:hypothetical protein CHS0354_009796 [Potamilus streckersoni]|uniref:Protein quiver n=1 Tax=Potamilus streckersoni TaxID=2493646 RepID=A0AAE0SQJ1_9BIVA|nr:hypothetical protein CHS0354_009796 [Potamilus streckersoni]
MSNACNVYFLCVAFYVPIKCYYCFAPAVNSTCADPISQKHEVRRGLEIIECDYGVCLKWTHYWNGKLHIRRTCSAKLSGFRIMMIDGVCRKERNDNGYLCMCGKNLCNTSCRIRGFPNMLILQLICLCVIAGFTSTWTL